MFTEAYTGQPVLTEDNLSSATTQIGGGLAQSVPILLGSWDGLTTKLHEVTSGMSRPPAGYQPEFEVIYRDQLASHVQTVGRVAGAANPRGAIEVMVTRQTAARFGLRAGSLVKVKGPSGPVLLVTAVVRERDPAGTFWTADPLAAAPELAQDVQRDQYSLQGAVLAAPGQLAAIQSAFCPVLGVSCDTMQLDWERRLVAGLMLCIGAIGGLVVLHDQGLSPAGVTNWYLTAAPVLVAIPAALIAMRLYPLAIRALLPVWRRRGGVAGYVGLAGAVERRTATALPAFTLVLALTLAAFGGMVNRTIVGGQISYSWQATGADAVIDTNGAAYDVTPAVEKSINAIPGVRHSTAVWTTTWQLPLGRQLTVAAVDPAGYAEVTADTPFPRIPVSAFGPADSTRPVTTATVVPVLASPAAAAALGPGSSS